MSIDTTPHGNLLLSICYQPLSWRLALGELIDNAFDAGANAVAISFERGVLQVRDDGTGCPDLGKFITLGDRLPYDSTSIGRYGIGAKDAMLWIGGPDSWVDVQSTHEGTTRQLRSNWKETANNQWRAPDVTERPALPGERGTLLTIRPVGSRFHHEPLQGARHDELVEALGYLYHPALRLGKQITIRAAKRSAQPVPVKPWVVPPFEGDVVDCTISVGSRSAHVLCGVLREGVKTRYAGMTYSYDFRVIVEASAHGCGDFGTAGVCGIIGLDNKWTLAKNKNDIGRHAEDLYAEVERVCRPVLERGAKTGTTLDSAALALATSRLLNKKPKRPEPPEPVEPAPEAPEPEEPAPESTEPPVTPPEPPPEGERVRKPARGGWKINFVPRDSASEVGEVKRPWIELNPTNPWVGKMMLSHNRVALATIAAALLAADHCIYDGRQVRIKGIDPRNFNGAMGTLLSGDLNIGGQDVETIEEDKEE